MDASDGPPAGAHNFHRGGSLSVYDGEAKASAVRLADEVDQALAMEIWQLALSSHWRKQGVWVHGDIAEGNLLVKDGRLSAVIDFGSSGVGDPSSDLILAWNVLDAESRAVFRRALDLDEATWQRGRGWALWKAWRGASSQQPDAPLRRAALMIVLTIGLHSLVEYPLWYAYFLLPACFALGLALPAGDDAPSASAGPWPWLGGLLIVGSLYAVWDYGRIVAIYSPSEDAVPLTERIATGQRSLFFSHQADYAAATSLSTGPVALAAAKRTAFNLVDARLLMQWSRSLEATGDIEGARYLADRLREFRNPTGDTWFAGCADPASAPVMVQCQPASGVIDWRTLR